MVETRDHQEGISAFKEKESHYFKGNKRGIQDESQFNLRSTGPDVPQVIDIARPVPKRKMCSLKLRQSALITPTLRGVKEHT